MRTGRLLIAAVLFLSAGLWVLFAYCNGNVGLTFGDSLTANKVSMDITTTGMPMLIGLPLAGLGLLLMLIAFLGAIVIQFRGPREVVREDESPRREIPFEE
jgi:hypothetical protein